MKSRLAIEIQYGQMSLYESGSALASQISTFLVTPYTTKF